MRLFSEPNDPFYVGVSLPNHYQLKISGAVMQLISHGLPHVTEDPEKTIAEW